MNNFFKILVSILILFTSLKCSSVKEDIIIKQSTTKKSIVARLTLEDSSVLGIKFPNKIKISNNSNSEKSFVKINYKYKDSMSNWRNLGIELNKMINDYPSRVSTTGKKTIPNNESLEFLYYTRHFIDSTKSTQQQFVPYIKRMLRENKDTLHIGSVSEFKVKHKALFDKLTKNDSLSIQFLDNKKLGERITVPVEW